jgi:hypothetical protein
VQDSPPGAAAGAVAVRVPAPRRAPSTRRSPSARPSRSTTPRTATAVLPAAQAPAWASAQLPADDAGLRAILLQAVPGRKEALEGPVALAVDAIADALDGRELSRDDLHEELRARLPEELLPWCEGCRSHHARRGLLVMASLRGRLCVAGRAGRQPRFARTDQWIAWDPPPRTDAGAELVRRYLAGQGPSTPAHFAAWAGLAPGHAQELWGLVAHELEPVTVDGAGARLGARRRRAGPPRPAAGPRDPPRRPGRPAPARPRPRAARAGPGGAQEAVDGHALRRARARRRPAAALWRARKQGRRLTVGVEPFAGPLPREEVEGQAARLASYRGCASVAVEWAA